jgi:hypothetical protein
MNSFPLHKSLATVRRAAARLGTELAQFVPNWKWRVDGVASAAVLIVLILDRTLVKVSVAGPWMNAFALFCVGFILHRNMGRRQGTGSPSPGILRRLLTSRRTRN